MIRDTQARERDTFREASEITEEIREHSENGSPYGSRTRLSRLRIWRPNR